MHEGTLMKYRNVSPESDVPSTHKAHSKLVFSHSHTANATASREFVVVRGCTIINAYTSSIFHAAPDPTRDPTQLPLNQ